MIARKEVNSAAEMHVTLVIAGTDGEKPFRPLE
jgi:hypothetical protein